MMTKLSPFFIVLLTASSLSGCVTQNYGNDKETPLIENESSNDEMAMTRITLGIGYLKMGNTQQAKLNLEKAKRFAPNLVQVHTAFAHYYDTVDEPVLATKAYEHALSIDSEDADTLNNYGVFLCRQEKYVAAEEQILKAIAVPSYILVAQSYENLALCQLKAKHFDKAEIYLEKAIAHSPNRASSLLQMMRLQYAKSDFTLAQAYLYRYEKSTQRINADVLALAFKIFSKQGNRRVAKNYGDMLVKMFPNSFPAKQYILNELYHIDADKLAEEYRASLVSDKSKMHKKRVVILSPNNHKFSKNEGLSRDGLKPIMANSVMPTMQKNAELLAKENKNKFTVKKNVKQVIQKKSPETVQKIADETDSVYSATTDVVINNAQVKQKDDNYSLPLPIHIVEKGDSLFAIAKHYNVVMKDLELWNKLDSPYMLSIGDELYLVDPKSAAKREE